MSATPLNLTPLDPAIAAHRSGAAQAFDFALGPALRLRPPGPPAPSWHLFTYVLECLLEARTPTELVHRAAASLGLLPQVAWTDVEGRAEPGPDALSILLEREAPVWPGASEVERNTHWLEVGLADPSDEDGRRLIHTVLALVSKLHGRELEARRLADAAYRDPLTGLWNRRGFMTFVDQALARRLRAAGDDPLALMICDLDHFKRVNDALGHAAGDLALRHVANAIQAVVRPSDVAARIGGDELVILLVASDASGALRVASRLRQRLGESTPLPSHRLTLSVGIADQRALERFEVDSVDPPPIEQLRTELFAAADRALYEAKDAGRDQARVDTLTVDTTALGVQGPSKLGA